MVELVPLADYLLDQHLKSYFEATYMVLVVLVDFVLVMGYMEAAVEHR